MYLQRNDEVPVQVEQVAVYDSGLGAVQEESTEIRQIYESQKLENVSYVWYQCNTVIIFVEVT